METDLTAEEKYPVGTKLRRLHSKMPNWVRGHVDGMLVTRRWLKHKGWWHYEVIDPKLSIEFVSLYTVEKTGGKHAYKHR